MTFLATLNMSSEQQQRKLDEPNPGAGRLEGGQPAGEHHSAPDDARRRGDEELLAARAALDDERQRYRDLFDFAPDAYLVTDLVGIIQEANHAAATLLDSPMPSLVGKPIATFFRLPDRQSFRSILNQLARQGRVDDWRIQLRDRRPHLSATVAVARTAGDAPTALRWLLRDVSERTLVEEQIRNLNEELDRRVRERTAELEQALAAKDEFLGLVSHELKTPITTIMGNAEVLYNHIDQIDAVSRSDALADIRQEADRLHHIIDNMLVLARLGRDQQVVREPVMLQRVIKELAERHRGEHPERRVILVLDPDLPPADAAPLYVSQVLRNLLSNAEKYSPLDEPIEVSVVLAGGEVEVRVLNHGTSIPPDEVDMLFRPFYRSPRTAEQAPGVGIGLSVCKRLIEAQDGRIWASARPGGGMEIGFSLPVEFEAPDDTT
jgi:PAS domain S-box-containing protein